MPNTTEATQGAAHPIHSNLSAKGRPPPAWCWMYHRAAAGDSKGRALGDVSSPRASGCGLGFHDFEDDAADLGVEEADGAFAVCARSRDYPGIGAGDRGRDASFVRPVDVPRSDRHGPDVCSVTAKELELAALGGASNQAAEPGRGPEVVDAVQGKRTVGVAGL